MVISTPRLCHDVAFLPPEKTKPHAIACTPVMPADAIPSYLAAQEHKAAEADAELDAELMEVLNQLDAGVPVKKKPQVVGDIEIGAHVFIPQGQKIEKSAVVGGGKETLIATIAKSDGFVATDMEMRKVGIKNGNEVETVKKEVERVARGKGWRLDVVETARGKELRGIIEAADDDKKGKQKTDEKDSGSTAKEGLGDDGKFDIGNLDKETIEKILDSNNKNIKRIEKEVAEKKRKKDAKALEEEGEAKNEESATGSEERYKEEL
jgi:protein OS-9